MTSAPAYSLGNSKRGLDLKATSFYVPGPGSYENIILQKTNPPNWKIGTGRRGSSHNKTQNPGPGTYNSPGKISNDPAKYSFGLKTQIVAERSYTPGPGAYETEGLKPSDQKPPSFTMRAKSTSPENRNRNDSPGPGAYEVSSRIRNLRQATYKMGTSQRDPLYSTLDNPGPGTYFGSNQDNLKDSPAFGFGTSERPANKSESKYVPGPGAYAYKTIFNTGNKGFSMTARRSDTTLENSFDKPGPGAYNPTVIASKNRVPSYKIGNSLREIVTREQMHVPGPGNYSSEINKRATSVKIGTSKRKPLNESIDTPGPGNYYRHLKMNDGPRYVMGAKVKDASQNQKDRTVPGPGAYEPSFELVKSHVGPPKVGTAQRNPLYSTADNPGPGVYDVKNQIKGPRWGFGTEKRGHVRNKSQEPGPGSYDLPSRIANLPKYAMTGSFARVGQ